MKQLNQSTARGALLALAAAAALAGCQSGPSNAPPPPRDPADRVITGNPANQTRRMSFGDLPNPVKDSFRREHARASVTDAGVTYTEPGVPLYRVVYTQDNLPSEATYRADGSYVPAEAATVLSNPPRRGPTTVPAVPVPPPVVLPQNPPAPPPTPAPPPAPPPGTLERPITPPTPPERPVAPEPPVPPAPPAAPAPGA